MSPTGPLRRRRGDLVATAVITLVAVVAVVGAWLTAPVRSAHLEAAEHPATQPGELSSVPATVTEVFSPDRRELPGVDRPVVAAGLVIAHDDHGVRALDAAGAKVWSYTRNDREVCSLAEAWDKVVVTFRSNVGCGDVVALDAATGQYSGTRSSINDDSVLPLVSNDRVGVVGPSRLDLWRSDLVRTVEYGDVEAKQEPNLQPHGDCEITSALTRTQLLAVTEICPDDPDHAMLRLMDATPEESRTPEIHSSVALPSPRARLVAIGQDAAAIYSPGTSPELLSYSREGAQLNRTEVARSPLMDSAEGIYVPPTADLPHHMTFFDGQRLLLLKPDTLELDSVIEGALGTGAGVGGRALVPVAGGIAVVDWASGETERVIPVDRGDLDGPVHLAVAGGILVESRGDTLTALAAG